MESIICTLFEGHYHYGVASLVNSLYSNGFRGDIYAGYRGQLPRWAKLDYENQISNWPDASTYRIQEDLRIHFLPVETSFQFTNYKPSFILQIMQSVNLNADQIFYFDPDIVIKCNWTFFEEWVSYGIALVHEITNNDMPPTHPVRQSWRKIIENSGLTEKRKISSYINAGFVGLKRTDLQFAELYKHFIEISIRDFNITVDKFGFGVDRTHPFFAKDQDALNLAAMCCDSSISEYGPEAMDFVHGGKVMSHAVGGPKPWKKNFTASMFRGNTPSLAEKEYWKNANGLINTYNEVTLIYKSIFIKITSFVGRFYRKY